MDRIRRAHAYVVVLAILSVPVTGCLSTDGSPSPDDVVVVHVSTPVGNDTIGYAVEPSSAEGHRLIELTLDALQRAEGPVLVQDWDQNPPVPVDQHVSLTLNASTTITWPDDDPPELRGVRAVHIVVAPTTSTPNLFIRTASHWFYYGTPADTAELKVAMAAALNAVRADNEGDLPYSGVQVKAPQTAG